MADRSTEYVVLPVESVRMLNVRTNDEVVAAQHQVDDDMINALEEMINAARAGAFAGDGVLTQKAAAW
jgi:hypothetical protein